MVGAAPGRSFVKSRAVDSESESKPESVESNMFQGLQSELTNSEKPKLEFCI